MAIDNNEKLIADLKREIINLNRKMNEANNNYQNAKL